jgi:Zn finger protein HypA/HybF involved in hydrogenase expression
MEQSRNITRQARREGKCLCCGQPFPASGPFLRVCPACKASEEWQSGNCDFVLVAANDNAPATD